MAWTAVGVVGGGEACIVAQLAIGGRSTRWFGRLEQENQRLKKHDGRWMDIVRSLQLESFILIKLTKLLVHQLSRPTGQLPKRCAPDVRGGIIFLAGEARISEIEEEARHPLDGHPTTTATRTVC